MAKKKCKTSRLFQLALNDVIKSSAEQLEKKSQWISTKEMIPQTVELKYGIEPKQNSFLLQQHGSESSIPSSKDLNKFGRRTSQLPTDDIANLHPVNLSVNSSNCSLTSKNPISVQDCPNSIYDLPISLFEQGNSKTRTDCRNPEWINPPNYNSSAFCTDEKLYESYGDQSGSCFFPKGTPSNNQLSESRTVYWPLTNELSSTGSTIPAPKSAGDFFNSSSYTDQLNALNCETGIPNPKSSNNFSDSFLLGDQIDFQNGRTAIPSPKRCDNLPGSSPFTEVACSTNIEVLQPSPNGYDSFLNSANYSNHRYSLNSEHSIPAGIVHSINCNYALSGSKDCDCHTDSVTFRNHVYSTDSKHSIPSPKDQNFFNSLLLSDQICLSNSEITIPCPKSNNGFDSSGPLTDKACSANCDMIVSAKQFENCRVELNSDIYQNQMSTRRTNCSSLKYDLKAQYSVENIPFKQETFNIPSSNIYISGSKPSENLSQKLPNLRDSDNELQKNIACDNLFPNDYLDELIKMGSRDSYISKNEKEYFEDISKTDSKLLNFNDNPIKSVKNRNYEKPSHIFDMENQNLKPSPYISFENPTLDDFEETSTNRKNAVVLADSSTCNLGYDYFMDQSNVYSTVPHSQSHLEQLDVKPKIKSDFCESESKLRKTVPLFLGHFDPLSGESLDNLTAYETKLADNFKTTDGFKDKGDSVKTTNSLLCSFEDEFSTSVSTSSLNSLVDSNFMTDCMSVNSCTSNSSNSINELISSEKNCNTFASSVFCNESRSKSLLDCNKSKGSSFSENKFFSKPSISKDSGIGFPLEETISNESLDKSSTCSEPELNVFSFIPKEQSSKLMCFDKNVIKADCKATATSTKFSNYEVDSSDFLVDDQQRIDNLIDQFIGL